MYLQDIFTAGSETSSTAIEWTFSELLKIPRMMEKAQEEVRQVYYGKTKADEIGIHELNPILEPTTDLVGGAGAEAPRYGPVLLDRFVRTVFVRTHIESSKSCVIDRYEVPAKSKVIINAWAIGRDPRYWKEAEIFFPERFLESSIDYKGADFECIPFGAGRRICPGITYAAAVVELTLAQLLFQFDWKLPGEMKLEDLDMTEEFGLAVRRKTDLCLVPLSYQNHLFY
ncbi:Cytochrome P450, E-class, group IV [Parasponia andersonii]|uniref:Cytochrome P450, E-class, group IV n=1 Tax=Parasponia andersonii TaxID=3476 RepID=A0A2P5B3W0_PARAD|nr:Cytochrome P450, E-class, group IV [Parasponia andersonii]